MPGSAQAHPGRAGPARSRAAPPQPQVCAVAHGPGAGPSRSLPSRPGTTLEVGWARAVESLDPHPPPQQSGRPSKGPQQVWGAGLPGSSQFPKEITQERGKSPGKPARPLQLRPTPVGRVRTVAEGLALLLLCRVAHGRFF